jgi:hypothetical protein
MISKKIRIPRTEELLRLERIVITLENGKTERFNPADELRIPTDPHEVWEAARVAPQRLAFWDYQAERMLRKVRDTEIALEQSEGETDLVYRRHYTEEGEKITEALIRARVNIDERPIALRKDLNALKEAYGFLRATTDAIRHRMFVLNKLLSKDADAHRG